MYNMIRVLSSGRIGRATLSSVTTLLASLYNIFVIKSVSDQNINFEICLLNSADSTSSAEVVNFITTLSSDQMICKTEIYPFGVKMVLAWKCLLEVNMI